jgi:hypothetical protein
MNFIRRHNLVFAILVTVVLMDIFSSVIYAAGSFTGNCVEGVFMPSSYDCNFVEYYFGVYNIAESPFIDPLAMFGRLFRIFNPSPYPS